MHINRYTLGSVCCVLALQTAGLSAHEPPPEFAKAVHDQLKDQTNGQRLMPDARDWRLDPAIFTELSPYSIPEIAIELPADQKD